MDARVIEMMMALAAKDSDLSLARALFVGLFGTLTKAEGRLAPPSPVALKYLFNAYAFYDPQRVPVSRLNPRVQDIAARTFELCDFLFHADAPPFLPTLQVDEKQALSEARALFQYFLAKFPQQISVEVLDAYLFVFAWKGESMAEFEQLGDPHSQIPTQRQTVQHMSARRTGAQGRAVCTENMDRARQVQKDARVPASESAQAGRAGLQVRQRHCGGVRADQQRRRRIPGGAELAAALRVDILSPEGADAPGGEARLHQHPQNPLRGGSSGRKAAT
ncbi:hypothetical protein KL932_000081 [Ogataea haglerorum]|nr:hypothetical protein KL914_000686 [Ogataea haglerorum]KAG7712816.1 hypothetical protein KL950_000687 [Ogataea haglerorum]KAG7742467.1 hypothetical protein KL923_000082 [Ogataea haglerorum]KAG7745051.1 hypothetical protein KL932_000081 [Ogataea haglerorum]KAG7814996.1 hypothetical protein KL924_000082 [Ogataea haglerorum]